MLYSAEQATTTYLMLFKKIIISLLIHCAGREEITRTLIHPHMPTLAKAGPGQHWHLGTQSGSPMGMAGTQSFFRHSCIPGSLVAGMLESGNRTWNLHMVVDGESPMSWMEPAMDPSLIQMLSNLLPTPWDLPGSCELSGVTRNNVASGSRTPTPAAKSGNM